MLLAQRPMLGRSFPLNPRLLESLQGSAVQLLGLRELTLGTFKLLFGF
jgi:hypothetical protein